MKYVLAISLFLLWQPVDARQRENIPDLGQAAQLMKQALCAEVTDKTGEKWKQSIEVDGMALEILYRLQPAAGPDSGRIFSYRIPVMDIDSITGNHPDSTLVFFTRSPSIVHDIAGDMDTSHVASVTTYMRVMGVRNLIPRLLQKVQEFQKYRRAHRSRQSDEIVEEALFQFLYNNQFHPADTRRLYLNDSLFVPKCRLCAGARAAFKRYSQWSEITEATDPNWEIGLLSPVLAEQKLVLEKLLNVSLQEYYTGNEFFTESEVAGMISIIAGERKVSMRIASGKQCPICDGAAQSK